MEETTELNRHGSKIDADANSIKLERYCKLCRN